MKMCKAIFVTGCELVELEAFPSGSDIATCKGACGSWISQPREGIGYAWFDNIQKAVAILKEKHEAEIAQAKNNLQQTESKYFDFSQKHLLKT